MPSRRLFAAALMAVAVLLLTGCGGSSSGAPKEAGEDLTALPSPAASPAADAKVIDVTITADSVTPSGTRIEVTRNQPIVLRIDAVSAGEIHVHSTPEKHIEFPAGHSEVTLKIDQPGVVDVEDHLLDKLIVQLEVR